MLDHIWTCSCGHECPATCDEMRLGRVYRCPGCGIVFAHVYPQGGGSAWIKVSDEDVEFHRLVKAPDDGEEP